MNKLEGSQATWPQRIRGDNQRRKMRNEHAEMRPLYLTNDLRWKKELPGGAVCNTYLSGEFLLHLVEDDAGGIGPQSLATFDGSLLVFNPFLLFDRCLLLLICWNITCCGGGP